METDALALYREHFPVADESDRHPIETVLHVLQHDGYLDRYADEYRFLSGLLEDWWWLRHGGSFVPIRWRRG